MFVDGVVSDTFTGTRASSQGVSFYVTNPSLHGGKEGEKKTRKERKKNQQFGQRKSERSSLGPPRGPPGPVDLRRAAVK